MKKHLLFITFIFSLAALVGAYLSGNYVAVWAWITASITSIDHFITLNS